LECADRLLKCESPNRTLVIISATAEIFTEIILVGEGAMRSQADLRVQYVQAEEHPKDRQQKDRSVAQSKVAVGEQSSVRPPYPDLIQFAASRSSKRPNRQRILLIFRQMLVHFSGDAVPDKCLDHSARKQDTEIYEKNTHRERCPSFSLRDPRVYFRLKHVQRQRTLVEHCVMKRPQIKFLPEFLLCPLA